jgi:hypothetical protein
VTLPPKPKFEIPIPPKESMSARQWCAWLLCWPLMVLIALCSQVIWYCAVLSKQIVDWRLR